MPSLTRLLLAFLVISVSVSIHPTPKKLSTGSRTTPTSSLDFFLASSHSSLSEIILQYNKLLQIPDIKFSENQYQIQISLQNPSQISASMQNMLENPQIEKYQIFLNDENGILHAEYYPGIVRGLETLSQLLSNQTLDLPVVVEDYPDYTHRGVMLDTSRHYFPVHFFKKFVDSLAFAKLNVFHWHISDDDSFPVKLESFPDIAKSAFSVKEIYTKQDIQEVIKYGKERGIHVLLEVDSPEHTHALGGDQNLQKLITCYDRDFPWKVNGDNNGSYKIRGGPRYGALNPVLDETYLTMEKILKEMVGISQSKYFHLGADEVISDCWKNNSQISEFMQQHNMSNYTELTNYYLARIRTKLGEFGIQTGFYWSNEDTFANQYPKGDVLQFWGMVYSIPELLKLYPDNKFVLSPGSSHYLDCGMGNKYGGNSWCDPYKTFLDLYNLDLDQYNDTRILGAEAAMWAELSNPFNTLNKIWSRTGGMAERLWNGKKQDMVTVVGNILELQKKLVSRGVPVSPITGQYCEQNPAFCFKEVQ